MENKLLVSYRRMGDKTEIAVQIDPPYTPKRGEIVSFNDYNNALQTYEKDKTWKVEEIKFQLPGILYIDVYAQ